MAIVIDGITMPEETFENTLNVTVDNYPYRVIIKPAEYYLYNHIMLCTKSPLAAVISGGTYVGFIEYDGQIPPSGGWAYFGYNPEHDNGEFWFLLQNPNDNPYENMSVVAPVPMSDLVSNIAWSNYDVKKLSADNGAIEEIGVHFPNSEAPKGMVIDGITLPPFPETGFKYEAVVKYIMYWGETPTTQFIYLSSNTEMVRIPPNVIDETQPSNGMSMLVATDFSGISYMCGVEFESPNWSEYQNGGFMQMLGEYDLSASGLSGKQIYTLAWSNHDIKDATAINPDAMEITVGNEIYWYAGYESDQPAKPSLPPYLCESYSWFRELGDELRRISGQDSFADINTASTLFETATLGKATVDSCLFDQDVVAIRTPTLSMLIPFAFNNLSKLRFVDLGETNKLYNWSIVNCYELNTLILRSPTVCEVVFISDKNINPYNVLYGTDISSSYDEGYVYVPKDLVDAYKSHTRWKHLANYIRAIEDYPEICNQTWSS